MDSPFELAGAGLRGQGAIGLDAVVFIAWLASEQQLRLQLFGAQHINMK